MTVRKGIPRQGKHRKEPTSGHFVQRSLRDKLSRSCGERANAGIRRRNGAGNLFMRENPYKRLPPIECRQDGSLYRMTPAQRKQANALIRRECCCYEDGNCMLLDDGDTHTCPQTISFSVCCKWFRWSVLPQIGTLEAEIFRDKDLKRSAAECSSQSPTGRNTVPAVPPEFTGDRKRKVNGKGGRVWTIRQEKSLDL